MKLSVIMPIYNEKHTLEEIITRVQETELAEELVLVDDGSTDGTREIVKKFEGKDGFVVVLHEKNQGKGAAVRSGFDAATGDIFLIQDADLVNTSCLTLFIIIFAETISTILTKESLDWFVLEIPKTIFPNF